MNQYCPATNIHSRPASAILITPVQKCDCSMILKSRMCYRWSSTLYSFDSNVSLGAGSASQPPTATPAIDFDFAQMFTGLTPPFSEVRPGSFCRYRIQFRIWEKRRHCLPISRFALQALRTKQVAIKDLLFPVLFEHTVLP